MKKKRTVFLFGAGSLLHWNSPKTSELTDLIRSRGFKTSDNETYITEFIYQKLIANGNKESEVNFETIINVIEELVVYYSYFNNHDKTPSLLKCFFSANFEEDIFNFSIKGGVAKHNYTLEIPKGKNYDFSRPSQHNETPQQFFLQHLLAVLLSEINERISHYAYHTKGHSVVNCESTESTLFIKWMSDLEKNSYLRLYTLNYDRIFKILMMHNGIEVFEGFDCGPYVEYSTLLRANVRKILSDFDCNVHYNLHGSAFWKAIALDKDLLPNPELSLTCGPEFPMNHDFATMQVEKGKTIMVTNIVTGYQKAQKTLITPLKQILAAFDRDCCFADEIYVIGYSLGDEHINESIKTALRHNENLKIIIVDPYFLKNDLDFQMAIKLFPFRPTGVMQPTTLIPHRLHHFFNGAIRLHTIEFKEFLEQQANPLHKYEGLK
ncbi:MAG: hypothetical protein JWP81_2477 [Ferruginibacter sp.]|nr:hypothetical protein [Ferruginibacter sp.]